MRTSTDHASAVRRTVEAVWRMESAQLIASLARLTRDVGLAEELAQDALVAALEQWPESGVPLKPGAWLMATARRRGIDQFRRNETLRRKTAEIGRAAEQEQAEPPDWDTALDEPVHDDVLRLVFIACHPVLRREARVALTLKMVAGLSTPEIARAFLVAESTVAQRIVRAKKALAAARVPFETPTGDEFTARLASVLEVIYLVFNEGYSATAGDDVLRPALVDESLRLVRILAGLVPHEPEVHGLAALLEVQASRTAARTARDGSPVLLLDQDRSRWDRLLVSRGLAALDEARRLSEARGLPLGPFALQASIAACHARARTAAQTDWAEIAALYDALAQIRPTPVVELNRAVAVSMAYGPAAGLEIVDRLTDDPALAGYHLLPSARADLLLRLGRHAEARVELERAASLTQNEQERRQLLALAEASSLHDPPHDHPHDPPREEPMSFQAYLDAVETKTGLTPRQIVAQAAEKGFDDPSVKAGTIVEWLAADHGLGRGHAMAIVHVIKNGPQISSKHVGTQSTHSDESDVLWLDGKASRPAAREA